MGMRFLSPEAVLRALELSRSSYRPKEIIDLQREIEIEIRIAELHTSAAGSIDMIRVQKIVGMKLRLDALYADWAEGKLL